MPPAPVDVEILGFRTSITPLPFKQSQPMLPTIAEILSIATKDLYPLLASGKLNLKTDVADPVVLATLLPSLGNLAAFLNDKLDKLAGRLLVTARVAVDDQWFDLVKPNDWDYVFNEHPELYLPMTIHAGRITFARFFPASGQKGKRPPE